MKFLSNLFYTLAAVVILLLFIVIIFAVPALLIVAAIQLFKAGFIFFGIVVCLVGIGLAALFGSLFN